MNKELLYISEADFYEKRYELALQAMTKIMEKYDAESISNLNSRQRISHLSMLMAMTMLKDLGYRIDGLDGIDYFNELNEKEQIEGIERRVMASDYIKDEDATSTKSAIIRGRENRVVSDDKSQLLEQLRRKKK